MPKAILPKLVLSATLVVAASFFVGCDSTGGRIHAYRLDPTPELDTLAERHDDIENTISLNYDTYFRQMNEDIGRFFLLDRPSRLTQKPIPY